MAGYPARRNLDSAAIAYAEATPNPYMGRDLLTRITMAANGIVSELPWRAAECREDLMAMADKLAATHADRDAIADQPREIRDWYMLGTRLESRIRAVVARNDALIGEVVTYGEVTR